MTYELAKQLKDAGFPQRGKGIVFESENEVLHYEHIAYGNQVYIPTLSELILACGDRFEDLTKTIRQIAPYEMEDCWTSMGLLREPHDYITVEGKTPEEAVAKLWLQLNAR